MKVRTFIILALTILVLAPAEAQSRKRIRKPEVPPEVQARQAFIERMTTNTARILFIDSIVVNKSDFLSHYILNPEAGTIEQYQQHYKTRRQPNAYVFTNELGNRCYLSQENNEGIINLYQSETNRGKWTRPTRLRGINDKREYTKVNYPFMMGDGETLYFAAEGANGLGGYDIYTSTYDKENGRFLTPVNMGMPFNSEANDYMLVIDEYSQLGFFATDRRQPQDTVCIYIFVPDNIRHTYSPDEYSPEQIAAFARIDRISDTWGDHTQLRQAIARLQMTIDRRRQKVKGHDFIFVINNDLTYYQLSDFRDVENVKRYHQLASLRARQQKLTATLNRARQYYVTASHDERDELRPEILASERRKSEITAQIHKLEKTIRNQENIILTKNK